MIYPNIKTLLIALALIWPHAALAKTDCAADKSDYVPILERQEKALLYRVQRCGAPASYLFGTFHSDSKKLAPIYDMATDAISKTDRLVLELVVDAEVSRKAQTMMTFTPDHAGMKSVVGDELFATVIEKTTATLLIGPKMMDRFKPWAIAMLVQYPPAEEDGTVLDAQLQKFAESKKIPVMPLERIEEQFDIFDKLPLPEQIEFLQSSMDQMADIPAMHAELMTHYLAHDLPAIDALSRREFDKMAKTHPKLAAYIEKEVVFARNERMASRLIPLLAKPTTVAIGALHLPGEKGLLHRLEQQGFKIEAVK